MFTQRAQIKSAPQIHTETDQMEERHAEAAKENPKITKKKQSTPVRGPGGKIRLLTGS